MGIVYIGSDHERVGCERGGKKAKKGYVITAAIVGNWGSNPLGIHLRVIQPMG